MYIYIYDSFVNQKKYDKVLARIETRITDLGLNGKIVRIGLMTSVHDIIDSEIRKGANTIIAVGNNGIFSQALNSIIKLSGYNKNVTLGLIPVDKDNNEIANLLGIGLEESACDILSARRIQTLDLGKANNNYFLTEAQITTSGTKLEIDENYTIETHEPGEFLILNLPTPDLGMEKEISNAEDGKLELLIRTKGAKKIIPIRTDGINHSYFNFQSVNIINEKHKLVLDKYSQIDTPALVTIAKEKINLIVGKGRNF